MVNELCEQVQSMHYYWKLVRDFVEGEHVIKQNGTTYLPMKCGQELKDYIAFKERAKPGDYTRQTLDTMHGMVMRRAPTIEKPESKRLDTILSNFDNEGHSFYQFSSDVFHDNIQTNFGGILLDMPVAEEGLSEKDAEDRGLRPYSKYYPAESIVDWGYRHIDSYKILEYVILKEIIEIKNPVTFETEKKIQYRVPCLDENGIYNVRLFKEYEDPKDSKKTLIEEAGKPIYVKVKGKLKHYVPFTFTPNIVAKDKLEKSMLYGVAELHKHYYMQSADYENGVHYTTIPTLWTTGHDMDAGAKDEKEDVIKLGGDSCLNLPESDARIGVVQFAGEGLLYSKQAKEETLEQIGITGTRAMSPDRAMAETAESANIHRMGENARLATYTRNMSECFTQILEWILEWIEVDGHIRCDFNVDFSSDAFDPNALNSIANLSREGKYPLPLVFEALKKGEYMPNNITLEQFMLLVELEAGGITPSEEIEVWRKLRNGEKVELPEGTSVSDLNKSRDNTEKSPEKIKQVSMQNGK